MIRGFLYGSFVATTFTNENRQEIEAILARYPNKKAALLPVLWLAQREFGVISDEVIALVSSTLDLSPAHVYGVVTFYTMFHRERVGKYQIQVCQTLPCAMGGCDRILAHLKKRLSLDVGETTADKRFTLSTVECLASCGTAPVMKVNDTYYENLTEAEADRILEGLE